jgi:type I restriction enzyme S subunit
MKRYAKYKDSGVEWIGVIPEGWDYSLLKRYCTIKRGSSPRPIDDPKYFDLNGEYSWVRISDVSKSERYLEETYEKLSILGASLSTKLEENNLFLSIAGSVGKPIINKIKCCIHDGFVWFQNLKVDKEYLFYIFKIGSCFWGLGKMGTQLNLNSDTVGMIFIPFPPLEEQKQIVAYLDEKTSHIDNLLDISKRKIGLLKEQRASIINQVITKGLDPNAKMKNSGVEWIGEIPEGWGVMKFKYVSEIVTGNTPSKLKEEEYYNKDGFLWVKPNNLKGKDYILSTEERLTEKGREATRIIPKGGILLCCIGGTLGKYGISKFDVSTNQQINSIIPKSSILKSLFCLYYIDLFTRGLIEKSNFATLPILTKTSLENSIFILPPLKEQEQIVSYLDEKTSTIDKSISIEERRIGLLKEYRQSIISQVVTGKIKVIADE